MSDQYQYPCNCGQLISVSVNDAGKSVTCPSCDAVMEMPGMREIKKLKPAETAVSAKPSKKWTREKGIYFSFGMGAIVIGLAIGSICYYIAVYKFPAERQDVRGEWNQTANATPPSDYPVWGFAPEPDTGQPEYELSIFDPDQQVWTFENDKKAPVPKDYFTKWGDSYKAGIESSVYRSNMQDLWKFWYEVEPKEPLKEWQEPDFVIYERFAFTFYSFASVGGAIALIGFGLVFVAVIKK